MKKIIIGVLSIVLTLNYTFSTSAWVKEGNGWINGDKGWSYMNNGIYADGWQKIDGNWYYFYKDTNFMAHDTIIDGYYINSYGVWTENIPYAIGQIMKNDMDYINSTLGNTAWHFYEEENVKFKDLCNGGWNVPDIIGNVYWIQDDESDIIKYFVGAYDVYSLGNQGGTHIYKVESGKVVESIPYNYGNSYSWRENFDDLK